MATYHVYMNWHVTGYRARVHVSTCPFCNDGRGIHPRASNRFGQWYGPYDTFQEAFDAAQQLGRYRRKCKHCNPR